ncbi:hypothetical protein PAXINDRAFT_91249 [Paxillus involutus ATCC 200175]|uniref:Tyr recombinase domain-containing protein n=1 Tax=Paxillus involutus ATCC 200175 TaxID=664439 RepID=A0A0C9T6M9_PAXIN|nr:hypothetical protein PAXINDRAFT_91249 [Paxillus involutus ATCC 200175]
MSEHETTKSSTSHSLPASRCTTCFDSVISPHNPSTVHKPKPYKPDLTPIPSPLRPHCLAKHRLVRWLPNIAPPRVTSVNADRTLDNNEAQRVLDVIGASWAESTKELYGTGLLVFHVYCDIHDVPDAQRAPISRNLLAAFLASCAGALSGSTISNYAAALRAWHVLHGLTWSINESEYKALLEGATRLAPASSKRPKCSPFTAAILENFKEAMNLEDPHDAAIFACLVSSFYCIAHLGEFTVPAISRFDPTKHISRAGLIITRNHNNLPVMKFSIPNTKTSSDGEEVHCAGTLVPYSAPHEPPSSTDPRHAIETHFRINHDEPHAHLFSWRHPSGTMRPLSKKEVIKRIDTIAVEACRGIARGTLYSPGHSLRIGGTLHYLLNGVPFDMVKTMGRWSSESFTLYLRHHALVLAPFLQHQPELMHNLRRYILPPCVESSTGQSSLLHCQGFSSAGSRRSLLTLRDHSALTPTVSGPVSGRENLQFFTQSHNTYICTIPS